MSNYLKKQQIKDKYNHVKKLIESRNIKLTKQQKKIFLESIKLSSIVSEAKFDYVALDTSGKEVQGVLDVSTQVAAIERLKEMGFFPIKVDKKTSTNSAGASGAVGTTGGGSFKDRNIKSAGAQSTLGALGKGIAGILPGVGRTSSSGFTKFGEYGPEMINFSDLTNRDYFKAKASKTFGKGNTYSNFITAVLRSFKKELTDDINGLTNDLSTVEEKERINDFKKAFDDKETGIANKIIKFIVFYEPETNPSNNLRKKIIAHLKKVNSEKKEEPSAPSAPTTPEPTATPATSGSTATPATSGSTDTPATSGSTDTPATSEPTKPTSMLPPPPEIKVSTRSSDTSTVTEADGKSDTEEEDFTIYEDMLDFLQKYEISVSKLRSLLGGKVKFNDVDSAVSRDPDLQNLGTLDPVTGKSDSKQFNYIVGLLDNEPLLVNFKNFTIVSGKKKDADSGEEVDSYKTSGRCGCLFVKTDESTFSYVLKDFDNNIKISNGKDNVKKIKFAQSFEIVKDILTEQVNNSDKDYADDLVEQIAFLYAHEPGNFETVNAKYGAGKVSDVTTLFKLIRLYVSKSKHYDVIKYIAKNHVKVLNSALQNKAKSLDLEVSYPTAFVVNNDKGIVEILRQRTSTDDLEKIFSKLSVGIHILDDDTIDKEKNKVAALDYCLEKIRDLINKEVDSTIDINTYEDALKVQDKAFDDKQLKIYRRYMTDYEKLSLKNYTALNKFKIEDKLLKQVFIKNELKLDGVYSPFYIK